MTYTYSHNQIDADLFHKKKKVCDWQQLWQVNMETGRQMINTPMAGLGIQLSNFFVQNEKVLTIITKVVFQPTGNY